MATVIPIWLRDIYAKIEPYPLTNMDGADTDIVNSNETELMAMNELAKPLPQTSFFIRGNEIYSYLTRYLNAATCNYTITFVIVSLRDLYWNQRQNLNTEQLTELDDAMNKSLPEFHSIFDYPSLSNIGSTMATSLFQLFGTITPFNVIHVPVRDFITAINKQAMIPVLLPELNIILQLSYEIADFWDVLSQQLITTIPLQC